MIRVLIVVCLSVFILSSIVFAEEGLETTTVLKAGKELITVPDWVTLVSGDIVTAIRQLDSIKTDTPDAQINIILKKILLQIEKMREDVRASGMDLDSYSINISVPPSVTVVFKPRESAE